MEQLNFFILGCILSFFTSVIISGLRLLNKKSETLIVGKKNLEGFLPKNYNYYSSLRLNLKGRFLDDA